MHTSTEESRMDELIFDKNEDWDKRVLCSDERCIGTIGPDGKCRECGKPYEGVLNPSVSSTIDNKEKIEAPLLQSHKPEEDTIVDEEWDNRVLCSDESCIGTIGPDGKCRECGKPQ
jgi:hypothetical protein